MRLFFPGVPDAVTLTTPLEGPPSARPSPPSRLRGSREVADVTSIIRAVAEGRLGRLQDALGFALFIVVGTALISGVAFFIWFNVTTESRAQTACRRSDGTVLVVPSETGTPGYWACGSG
jgi:hypothetical protein